MLVLGAHELSQSGILLEMRELQGGLVRHCGLMQLRLGVEGGLVHGLIHGIGVRYRGEMKASRLKDTFKSDYVLFSSHYLMHACDQLLHISVTH